MIFSKFLCQNRNNHLTVGLCEHTKPFSLGLDFLTQSLAAGFDELIQVAGQVIVPQFQKEKIAIENIIFKRMT